MSSSFRATTVRKPLSRAVASVLVLSFAAPHVGVARDTVPFEDLVAWGMQADSAGQFAALALNTGLDRGLESARASGLPFLGSLQGGITYDHALRRFDYDLLTLLRLLGDGEGHAWLAQIGAHNLRDRRTVNAGLVYRWIDPEAGVLLGANAFLDRDFDAGANRLGAGLEAMTETTRVFTNVYAPQGAWGVSPDDPYLEERPARGYDLGIAYTPRWLPAVDLQLKGAQWKGAAVDVFGTGDAERDPTVWSAKLGLAPVPAVLVGLEHSRIAGGAEDLRLSLTWTHRFGLSVLEQWTPGNTAMRNDLRQRALMPVEREKRIVMETRERYAEPLFAAEAMQATVLEGEAFDHLVQVTGGALPLAFALVGTDAALFRLSGPTLHLPAQDLAAPADADGDNVYDATVVATDARGRQALQRIAVTVQAAVPGVRNARIEGEAKVDRTLTLSFDYHSPVGEAEDAAGRSLQWFRRTGDSTQDIAGATDTTYVPVVADIGYELGARIVVRSVDGRSNEAWPAEVIGARVEDGSAPTASPSIAGVFEVGSVLTGTVGYADADGDAEGEHRYQWYRADDAGGLGNRTAIDGAISVRYTMVAADQGKYLVFEVTPKSMTGTPAIGQPATAVTATTVVGSAPMAKDVRIAGEAVVGRVLTGGYTYDDVDGDVEGESTYQWYRSDDTVVSHGRAAIAGATSATYTVVAEDFGKTLFFVVTPKSLTGDPIAGAQAEANTGLVVGTAPVVDNAQITGDPIVGKVLTLEYDYTDADGDPEGDTSISWCYEGGACWQGEPTFAVPGEAEGKRILVNITPRSATGLPNTGTAVATAPTAVVTRVTALAGAASRDLQWLELTSGFRPLVASGGTAPYTYEVVGEMPSGLSLNPSTGVVSGVVAIGWIPAAEAAGDMPAWEPTFRVKDANNVYAASTNTVRFDLIRPQVWVNSLEIEGELTLGSSVQALVGVATTLPGDSPGARYQWYRADDANMGNLSAIPGATASTHAISSLDVGKYLVLEATPTTSVGFSGIPVRSVTDRAIVFQQ